MNKSKLEILLKAVDNWNIDKNQRMHYSPAVKNAYNAYMEERKTIPQAGQEIEVWDRNLDIEEVAKFIGFTTDGRVVSENIDGIIDYWYYYRIPTPKKKWKVVRGNSGFPCTFPYDHPTDLPTITTFED